MTQPHGRIPAETVEGIEQARIDARQALQDERDAAQDNLGHDSTCRRRNPPSMGADHKGIDPDNCERCRYLQGLLDQAQVDRDQFRTASAVVDKADRHGYVPGETVEVHAMGSWYTGQVTKATAKTVTVRYTSGAGVTRDKTVSRAGDPDMVKVRRPGETRRLPTRGR